MKENREEKGMVVRGQKGKHRPRLEFYNGAESDYKQNSERGGVRGEESLSLSLSLSLILLFSLLPSYLTPLLTLSKSLREIPIERDKESVNIGRKRVHDGNLHGQGTDETRHWRHQWLEGRDW